MTALASRLNFAKARRRSSAPSCVESARAAAVISVQQVDAELARFSLIHLAFPRDLEARYETDTGRARARNIVIIASLGLFFYMQNAWIDGFMYADLGRIPYIGRLLVAPLVLFVIWMAPRARPVFREGCLCFTMTVITMTTIAFIGASRAPLAAYTIIIVFLACVFGSILMRLRFVWSCVFIAVVFLCLGTMLFVRSDLPGALTCFLWITTFITVTFSIIVNNQLERDERHRYLLALREQVRSEQLSLDKDKLSTLSLEDALTGVANRRAFDARLADLVAQSRAGAPASSLLMIDVDHFKLFNDHYGHPAGDACLQRVTQALKDVVLRKQDLLARYGGEEFAVLLVGCGTQDAANFAQRLRRAIFDAKISHAHRGDDVPYVTVSIGVASLDGSARNATASDLVARADKNLYAAKRLGRNRIIAGDVA